MSNSVDSKLREWLKERFEKLGDISSFLLAASPEYRTKEEYLQKLIIDEPDINIAQRRVDTLEKVIKESKGVRVNHNAIKLQKLRIERTEMLFKCDYTQLPDVPLTSDQKKQYREYRAFLRELPQMIERDQYLTFDVPSFEDWKKRKNG